LAHRRFLPAKKTGQYLLAGEKSGFVYGLDALLVFEVE
jgi:hypothetical protein